jgi:restriction system protein
VITTMSPRRKRVRVGDRTINEPALLSEIERVQSAIAAWARERDLWHDSSFAIPFLYHDEAPRSDQTLLLVSEGPLASVFNLEPGYAEEYEVSFNSMLEDLGYWYEVENHYSMRLYPMDDGLNEEFLSLHRWQWLQSLAKKKLFDLHAEVYEHFARYPEYMKNVEWRQFEQLLDSIFRNQGFHTELGPGSNDGGVDLRLYQDRAIPEIVTLVQAKRYAHPIKLEAVAALFGHATVQNATDALFVTTSYFQPAAQKFSLATQRRADLPGVRLADAKTLAEWCAEISQSLTKYFANGLGPPPSIRESTGPLAGSILVAHDGYNCTNNYFAIVEADFPKEVILRPIGSEVVSGDWTAGSEIPSESSPVHWTREARLLAFKQGDEAFRADRKVFALWDGTPQYFNSP